ncbi:HAMP domain-containing protein [Betaproteobacteria bacterium SCN1]|jgi:adenylate cyclase|nr:HAMP domain-containing protein [Betaproteobacteria bacterium SCN1]MBN8760530.1 adenylate/guanylate cyclase domain-containing protein [Thiobacillus sp.]ODU88130.1 MAG: adenylate/guanylate cyclase [Thiobacillus sp. SCN 65-179]OJW36378.1 MAG: adenylate/guanylate cyclase domain-containing protein [Thiobacillus sp. 65-69]
MRLPISLKIFSITLALLVLMVIVTWLSVLNFRQLNNQVRALADTYLPLQQQVASVEILIRQQMVHMERVMAGMDAAKPDPAYLEKESTGFDMRGINADQIIDSSLRMLAEAEAQKDIELDRVTLAILGKQLPAIQTARQHFHMRFRQFQIEAEEGTPRSEKIVRDALLQEKDTVDIEIGKAIDTLNKLTQDTASQAKKEEERATTLNWIVTAIASALGLIFAAFVTRSLVDPVKRLLGGTRAVEAGDLDVEILVRTHDELATLAASFNHMVGGLREKERIRATFGQYVDPRIVRNLLENRIAADKGERQTMTVFFSDLEGFTQLCEGLTPDMAVRFLNRYFTLMSEGVRERQGIVDKYIGDAVMAFWGPPFVEPADHARLACLAALDQMARLDTFRAALPELFGVTHGLPTVNVRMGLASGDVTVGNIGSETSRGYTVIGDTVNLASRLEQANKFYGTRILVSDATRTLAGDSLAFREIDSLRVAGKQEPVKVHELLGLASDLNDAARTAVRDYETGLAHYRAQGWEAAEAAFRSCLSAMPGDRPAQVMLERIAAFRQSPPEAGWDGVWVAGSK